MTPEEIADQLFMDIVYVGTGTIDAGYPDWEAHKKAIAQAIRDAYERAAQVAESTAGGHYMARVAAAAIRTLKGAP